MGFKGRKRNKYKKKKNYDRAEYQRYLHSAKWKEFRQNALEILGKNCSQCGNKNDLEIHHKHYNTIFKETIADVMVVCGTCHKKIHKDRIWKNGKKSKYMKDPNYDTKPVTYYPKRSKINIE